MYVTFTYNVSVFSVGITSIAFPFSTLPVTIVPLASVTTTSPIFTGSPVAFVTVTSIVTLPAVLLRMFTVVVVGILFTVNSTFSLVMLLTFSFPRYVALTVYVPAAIVTFVIVYIPSLSCA